MPYGDRTGPMGLGPMTGRGMGFCGRRGGRFNRGFNRQRALTKEEEKQWIEAELKELELEKQALEKRLSEL